MCGVGTRAEGMGILQQEWETDTGEWELCHLEQMPGSELEKFWNRGASRNGR